MIYSMYCNAGILSLIYPIAVFGYALFEETRPAVKFWKIILYYTVIILLLKYTVKLHVFEYGDSIKFLTVASVIYIL